MKQHFVTFYSPGTFVAEQTTKPIDTWDVEGAKCIADDIVERYGATPYAFQFSTRERRDTELDSHTVSQSPWYYLGGKVLTLEEVRAQSPDEKILISNMESNGWKRVIKNTNSWSWVQPLEDDDVVLDYTPPKRKEKP